MKPRKSSELQAMAMKHANTKIKKHANMKKKTTASKQTDSTATAQPQSSTACAEIDWYNATPVDDLRDGPELPPWVKELDDKSDVKCVKYLGFFYRNEADYKCGMSYHLPVSSDHHSWRIDYNFGPYGTVRIAVIEGEAWCSLEDAGRLAGIPIDWITGRLPHDQLSVRGVPGHLVPDGIRTLDPQGMREEGVRFEAIFSHVEEHRRDQRVSDMLWAAIDDIYCKQTEDAQSTDITCVQLWQAVSRPMAPGQILMQTVYHPMEGDYSAVRIGTQLWFLVDDISRFTQLEVGCVIHMAGSKRTLKIQDAMVYPLPDSGGERTYIRADAFEKIIAAIRSGPCLGHRNWFIIRDMDNLWRGNDSVKAITLHQMLGSHLDFEVWRNEMRCKHWKLEFDHKFNWSVDHEDYPIPLLFARDIAAKEGTFAGDITARLLTEGGYLHGGPIDETPDATLERFIGLVPDRHGRVHIRKLWEFKNTKKPFDVWSENPQMKCEDPPNEHLTKETHLAWWPDA